MVICAEKKKIFDRMAVIAGNFADGHLIEGYRDGADAVLCENLPEQAGKRICVNGLTAQNFHELIQHAA